MKATIALMVLIGLGLLAPLAGAQAVVDPAQRHIDQKAQAAQDDPVRLVVETASVSGASNETSWSVAYGCYVVDRAHHDYGTPRPNLDQCKGYEEVIGVEDEPDPVSDVENLTDDPVAEVKDAADDGVATAEKVVAEPEHAVDTLGAFLGRLVDRILGLVGGAAGGVLSVADGALRLAMDALALDVASSVGAVRLMEATSLSVVAVDLEVGKALVEDASSGVDVVVGAAALVAHGVADAAQAAAQGVADASVHVARSVSSFVDHLLGSGRGGADLPAGPSVDPALPGKDGLDSLPCVRCVLEKVAA